MDWTTGHSHSEQPLVGVELNKFSLRYRLAPGAGVPLTSDYDFVHENTYLWLFTVMHQTWGEQLKNLLTEDTSNKYASDQPITIQYSSIALFDENDAYIPSRDAMNNMVREAFTGSNLQYYLEGIQNLPAPNPFRYVTLIHAHLCACSFLFFGDLFLPNGEFITLTPTFNYRFQTSLLRSVIAIELYDESAASPGQGGFGLTNPFTSSMDLMPPLAIAAALFLVLTGAATIYKYRNHERAKPPTGKNMDSFSRGGTATETFNDEGLSLNPELRFINTRGQEDVSECSLIETKQRMIDFQPVVEEATRNPDLAGWSEFFESVEPAAQMPNEDESLYSIEDFVLEAERSLLGARIRYPSERGEHASDPPAVAASGENNSDEGSAFIPVEERSIANQDP